MNSVNARLSRLERSAWRWRAACVAIVALAFVGAETTPKSLTVRALYVVDKDGGPLVNIAESKGGGAFIEVRSGDGLRHVSISADNDSASVGLGLDSKGAEASISSDKDRGGSLSLAPAGKNLGALIYNSAEGTRLMLHDANGLPWVRLPAPPAGR